MITIKIRKWSCAYKISVSGHSGYAAVGSDIVCAGVSAFAYALLMGQNATQHENTADPDKALMEYGAKWSAHEILGYGKLSVPQKTVWNGLRISTQKT